MIATSALSWLVLAGTAGARVNPEALYGMLGPLAVASVSWTMTERTYRSAPEKLTGVLVEGLLIKALFFGLYVVVMLRVIELRPVPFVLCFTGYFIGLYVMEALFMRRLFSDTN